MFKFFNRRRGRRTGNGHGERPWTTRSLTLVDAQDMFELSLANDDDDEKPWITRLVAEKFFYELSNGQYEKAWHMLESSKQKDLASDIIKEKWETYAKNQGGLKQRIGSKVIGSNNDGSVISVTFRVDDDTSKNIDVYLTIIKDSHKNYRIFECTPVEDTL
ncbi:MAG: DUF3887 domain-containing protein [Leptolyngbyaceae cyanobacterium MAG.088]|nr:DUF3887 domain-containing protein [Leptolyngbyaceae cyanobacterium MAG.088]